MKRKIVYVSNDGKTLESRDNALKYLDDQYGNAMTSLAHKIASTTPKYYSLVEYLTSDNAKSFMKKGLDALKEKEEFLRYEKDLENDDSKY